MREENEELKVKLLKSDEKLQQYFDNEKQHQDAELRIAALEKENSNLRGNVSGLNRKINQLQKLCNSEEAKNAELFKKNIKLNCNLLELRVEKLTASLLKQNK